MEDGGVIQQKESSTDDEEGRVRRGAERQTNLLLIARNEADESRKEAFHNASERVVSGVNNAVAKLF